MSMSMPVPMPIDGMVQLTWPTSRDYLLCLFEVGAGNLDPLGGRLLFLERPSSQRNYAFGGSPTHHYSTKSLTSPNCCKILRGFNISRLRRSRVVCLLAGTKSLSKSSERLSRETYLGEATGQSI
ncbi:MAG: hypothetical protein Q9177_001914 [Variospora cf. flavescens]